MTRLRHSRTGIRATAPGQSMHSTVRMLGALKRQHTPQPQHGLHNPHTTAVHNLHVPTVWAGLQHTHLHSLTHPHPPTLHAVCIPRMHVVMQRVRCLLESTSAAAGHKSAVSRHTSRYAHTCPATPPLTCTHVTQMVLTMSCTVPQLSPASYCTCVYLHCT
jgi:hypothetical protein